MRRRRDIGERFWSKVRRSAGCWEWTAGRFAFGYGRFSVSARRKSVQAHRVAWEMEVGPIPEGMFVCHHCDKGTIQDNTADMDRKGRRVPARASRPGENNPNARLTAADVAAIRASHASGTTQSALAGLYGVRQAHISRIVLMRNWR